MGHFDLNCLQIAEMEVGKMTLLWEGKEFLLRLIWYFLLLGGSMGLSSYLPSLVCGDRLSFTAGHDMLSLIAVWSVAAFILLSIFADVVRNVHTLINIIWDKFFTSIDYASKQDNRSIQVVRHVVWELFYYFLVLFLFPFHRIIFQRGIR
jgi:hypothetical protein